MAVTTLTETEANVLFDILVKNAGHNDDTKGHYRAEFIQQFTDPERYRGEYWFSGQLLDFKLIADHRGGNGIHWKLIKQTVPSRNSLAAEALTVTNEALVNAYAEGKLSTQRWITGHWKR